MSLLKALATTEQIEEAKDSLGGNAALETDAYVMTVAMAYIKKSSGGALGLHLHFKTADGKDFKTAQYMTGGDAKGNLPYYTDKDGKKQFLPGFNIANSLTLLTVGKEISDLDTEPKVIKLYNSDAGAEVPTTVDCVTDLLGAEIIVGLVKQIVDKTKKNDAGVYVPTGETREENDIDKLFRAKDKMTKAEISGGATSPDFYTAWLDKNKGITRNKAGKGSTAGTAGAPKAGSPAGTGKPNKPLFG